MAFIPTHADYAELESKIPKPKTYGALHDIGAGVANPLINTLNWIVHKGHQAAHVAGLPENITGTEHPISNIPHGHGVAYTGGQVGGYLIPGVGEDVALMKGVRALKSAIPELEGLQKSAVLRGAGRLGRGAAVGIGTAVPARPADQSAKSAAIGGGLGGAIGEGLQGIIAKTANPLLRTARFQNFKNAFLRGKTDQLPQGAQRDAVSDVVDSYHQARKGAQSLYDPIWDKLERTNKRMEPRDLQDTLGLMGKDKEKSLLNVEDLPVHDDGRFDPQQFHFEISKINQAANKSKSLGDVKSNQEARQGFKYAKAMRGDFNKFLEKHNLLTDYTKAQENWKKNVLPYTQSKIFKTIYKELAPLEEGTHQIEGHPLTDSSMQGLKDTAPISKIAKKFLPGGEEATDNALNEFATLLGGDKEMAKQHGRNLLFSKHYNGEEMDFGALSKDLSKLKGENRDLLLTDSEKGQLKEMKRLGKMKLGPWKKAALSMAVGGAVGHHLFGSAEGIGGAGVAGLIAEPYLEPLLHSALGSAPLRALERGLRKEVPVGKVGMPLGAILSQPSQGDNES